MGAVSFYGFCETEAEILAYLRNEIGKAHVARPDIEWSIQVRPQAKEFTSEDSRWAELLEEWLKSHLTTPSCIWVGQARIHT